MISIMGIDPDTKKISIVEGENQEKFFTHTVNIESKSNVTRAGLAYRGMCEVLSVVYDRFGSYPIVYMEAPILGRNSNGSLSLAFIHGAVMTALDEFDCVLHHVYSGSWKARVLGKGDASKVEIVDLMKEVWPELHKQVRGNQDLIDAGAIYLFGKKNHGIRESLRRAQAKKEATK